MSEKYFIWHVLTATPFIYYVKWNNLLLTYSIINVMKIDLFDKNHVILAWSAVMMSELCQNWPNADIIGLIPAWFWLILAFQQGKCLPHKAIHPLIMYSANIFIYFHIQFQYNTNSLIRMILQQILVSLKHILFQIQYKNSLKFNSSSNEVITMKLCTSHDSSAVVTCATFVAITQMASELQQNVIYVRFEFQHKCG